MLLLQSVSFVLNILALTVTKNGLCIFGMTRSNLQSLWRCLRVCSAGQQKGRFFFLSQKSWRAMAF